MILHHDDVRYCFEGTRQNENDADEKAEINSTGKPPLGCPPYYVKSLNRILALTDAIERNVKSANYSFEDISMWSHEIILQCELCRKMEEYKRGMVEK